MVWHIPHGEIMQEYSFKTYKSKTYVIAHACDSAKLNLTGKKNDYPSGVTQTERKESTEFYDYYVPDSRA